MEPFHDDYPTNKILLKLKSKYVLNHIFDNLNTNKFLNIIRYNKNLQKKLDKNKDSYKSEYLKIIIEIIPKVYGVGNFINIKKIINLIIFILMIIKMK